MNSLFSGSIKDKFIAFRVIVKLASMVLWVYRLMTQNYLV